MVVNVAAYQFNPSYMNDKSRLKSEATKEDVKCNFFIKIALNYNLS
jgi:hypothetical protein